MAPAGDNLASPNAIPQRTSSTGLNSIYHQPSKPVLKPLPEESWISPINKLPSKKEDTSTKESQPLKENVNGSAATEAPQDRRHSKKVSSSDASRYKAAGWSAEKERIILGPYEYVFSHPGKDIRTQLLNAFNIVLHVPPDSLKIITKVVGMLHTSSLLIDDVEDSSELRRGIPVAHNIFGTAQTINSANYVYFLALQELQTLKNRDAAMSVFVSELLNLHRGQGMDLFWRDTLTCPTEDDYLEMVQNKTGGLFRLAIKLMQTEAQTPRDCVPLVNLMGLIFQICDDYLNLSSTSYTQNKGMCEDLTEGKFSFPVIHSIRAAPDNLQLINILKQKTKNEEVKRYAISYMEGTGSFEYTRKVVAELKAKAEELIQSLDDGKTDVGAIRTILQKFVIE